jgi:putative glutamine amidotransferase
VARGAVERDLPLLGICRGMQTLNVALGGTLVQHLPDLVGSDRHRAQLGAFGEHEVRLEPGSLAARASGAERLRVKSHHHQGLAELGEGLVASGFSEPDRVIEAIELPERRFALGVLWHCEEDERSALFGALVAASRGGDFP